MKANRPEPKRPNLFDKLPRNHGEWLEVVIRLTEKAGPQLAGQAIRLREELSIWKEKNR